MANANLLSCVILVCAGCSGDKAPTAPHPVLAAARVPTPMPRSTAVPLDPHAPLRLTMLGAPVRSSRTWTTALVPNARGGWNLITQTWELGSSDPPEFVIIDLAAGKYTVTDAARNDYAVSKYQVRNELRAPNGRVFFPLSGAHLAYYDPTDETIKDVPPVLPPGEPDKSIYSAVFGPDGMLYGGTQTKGLPTIVQIDPNTLTSKVLGHVGRDRKTYSYAYQIAVDPPWVYATVGEMPWELAALNIKTGESKILATRADRPWMSLETKPEGVRAQLVTNVHTPQVVSDYVWCVDGQIIPDDRSKKVPFKARNLTPPATEPLPGAPELDLTRLNPDASGVGRVRWRAPGTPDWKLVEYKINHTAPIAIEALTPLPDGGVLGGTKDYHGFFRTDGSSLAYFGGPTPSRSVFAWLDGTLYTTGYPNAVLYAYDPKRPWTGTTPDKAKEPGANPRMLGNFTESGAKYSSFLVASQNRLYFAGRLERDGVGAGVGYYEPATKKFAGHHKNLADVVPQGLAVLPDLGRVVLSERVRRGGAAAEAELVVYDKELAELERLVVKPGLTDTGLIVRTPTRGVIVGISSNALYRYDLVAKKLLAWKDLPVKLEAATTREADGSLWAVIGTSLVKIDLQTLDTVTFGQEGSLPVGVETLAWQGKDLYASAGADLYKIERVGLP